MSKEKETPYNNNLFSNHFLEERLQNLEEWKKAEIEEEFDKIQELWDKKKRYLQNQPNEDNTQDEWINEILKIIGHNQWGNEPTKTIGNGRNLNPDYLFFKDFETKLDSEDSDNQFEEGYLIGEAKKWDRTLDKSMDNHENPSFQIFNYVDRLRTPWGLLTNGKKWRLYSYEDCEADTFYEIDIVETILKEKDEEKALQNFKYFYLFFRKESFVPSQNAFVDQVFEGSENYAKGLEEDLEDDIYTALEVTARGFFETNDIEKTEENIEKVHRASLILLYRMLFILNAESRGLLPMDEKKYRLKLSLEYLKGQLEDENDDVFSEDTWAWDRRIRPLFEAINEGEQYGEFKITAYNGGLFDEDKHPFLAQHELQGNHLREILELLAQSTDEETGDKVLVDYRDLNIRHLGSVYEGLLEHELRKAKEDLVLENGEWESATDSKKDLEELPREKKVREGEVYLTNESGERKATGSYYTPEYIVEYIVENTVGPKVEDKIEESDEEELLDNVLDLNICDPAMGSGHFLTEATSFIARRVLEHGKIQDEEVEGENEFVWVKRQVVSHCIYGVDINPLAVELGKLSLWIETMAEGHPLSFLDHHLKVGNSLVGSQFNEIFIYPFNEEQKTLQQVDDGKFRFGSPVEQIKTFKKKYEEIENMDEETVEQIHEKEEKYKEFQKETLYQDFKELANIHTQQHFENDITQAEYESELLQAVGVPNTIVEDEDWYQSAQEEADKQNYFHWELEFPKVFFGDKEGFDAVVGNPPYLKTHFINDQMDSYYRSHYKSALEGAYDVYTVFLEKGYELLEKKGREGYILPNKFFEANYGKGLRNYLIENSNIKEIVSFGDKQVFEDVSTYTCIITLEKSENEEFVFSKVINKDLFSKRNYKESLQSENFSVKELPEKWNFHIGPKKDVLESVDDLETLENKSTRIFKGFDTGMADFYVLELVKEKEETFLLYSNEIDEEVEIEKELVYKLLKGKDFDSFKARFKGRMLFFPYETNEEGYSLMDIEDIEENYPKAYNYLKGHEEELRERQDGKFDDEDWYRFANPRNLHHYSKSKICTPYNAFEPSFIFDQEDYMFTTGFAGAYGVITENSDSDYQKALTCILNSNFVAMYMEENSTPMRGNYYSYEKRFIKDIPIPENFHEADLDRLHDDIKSYKKSLNNINLELKDYLGSYDEGKTLNDLYTPASGVSDTPLTDTASDREKLQVGSVDTQRNGDSITLLASARYKPEDESGHDTDQYGYTETEMFSAMEFHDLSETEKALIEEFVPVAVDEAGGFADFRKKATKTMSLIDRLKKLTLPKVSDVEDDLQKFIKQRNKAEELEEKIQETDQEINEIVYDLYDLTEEEIEIVEESIN